MSKGKDARTYLSVLLRTSSRVGKKVVSKTLAILTDLPDWLLNVVERSVIAGGRLLELGTLGVPPFGPKSVYSPPGPPLLRWK